MAESYGVLLSRFFDGETGVAIQARGAAGKDALILATFLAANQWANMIGLYELSVGKIARKLPILKGPQAVHRAMSILRDERYADFDDDSEFVWVREMARIRLNLVRGDAAPMSKRIKGAQYVYQRLPLNPFLGPFFDRYGVELSLPVRRDGSSNGVPSPIDRRSITDRSTTEVSSAPPRTPPLVPSTSDQRSGTRDQRSGIRDQMISDQESAAAAPPPTLLKSGNPIYDAVEVITTLVAKEIMPLIGRHATYIELRDATEARCFALKIPHNAEAIRRAIESAQFRAGLRPHPDKVQAAVRSR